MPIEYYRVSPAAPQPTWRYKVIRAEEHLAAVRAQVEWFRQNGPYVPLTEFDTETGRHRIVVESVREIPLTLPMIIGDCAHNLRAALDHLWCAILNRQQVQVTRSSQFPIFDREPRDAKDRAAWRKRIGDGLPPELLTAVQGLQPYSAREFGPIERHPLYVLNELDRRDKHFAINLVAVRSGGTAMALGDRYFALGMAVELEPGAVIGEFGPSEIGVAGRIDPEMNMALYGSVQIAFEERWADALDVDSLLTQILSAVAEIISKLERFALPVLVAEWQPGPHHSTP